GELYLSGEGLAQGYHGRPDLTAAAFVPHPFSTRPGARLYRTGDLARHRGDGAVEFLGRADDQVKIRGFRIEPGEIQAVLGGHPDVAQAVVLARPGAAGEPELAAWAVPRRGAALSADGLRRFLAERLPACMVPARFALLEAMPLNANGKVDRHALPEPELAAAEGALPPRSDTERRLARLWEDLLAVRPVGARDSFFDLGGHSLLAVRLMRAVQAEFGIELPLSLLFEAPTVEALAAALDRPAAAGGDAAAAALVAIQPRGARPPFFCVHPGLGEVMGYRPLAQAIGEGQPFYGLRDPFMASLEGDAFTPVETLASCYVEAIRRVQPQGPYLLGGYSFGGMVAFEMARQLQAAGSTVALLALIDSDSPARLRKLHRKLPKDKLLLRIIEREPAASENAAGSLRIFKSRIRAGKAYEPGALQVPVTFLRSSRVEKVPGLSRAMLQGDETLGWAPLCAGLLAVRKVAGTHASLILEPDVRGLARALDEAVRRALEGPGPSSGRRASPFATEPRSMNMVEALELQKTYPGPVEAVRGISFEVRPGEIFGLLGPNGAGKSTTIRMLTTLTTPTAGDARVGGFSVLESPQEVRRRIGYVAQNSGVDALATGRENLSLQGRLLGVPARERDARVARLIETFQLGDAADRIVRTWSGGMKRRLDLAMGLVHKPAVLFLDEPTTGLDPESRRVMWDEIRKLIREEQVTLLLTTHYLEEADQLAQRLAIVDQGRIVAEGTPDEL
ncbi:MAG TPA: ATP-binding cassette domain-containing protein, partial [Thermoanaerobaculia bacterium]|nr:ATP-binding cassette domain-containing protein [Thermoanaerobaculia bacterium]